MENKSAFNVNTLLCGMLTIAFVVMKLTGVIGWSWWWVLAPLWIPLGVGLIMVLFVIAFSIQEKWEIHFLKKYFGEHVGKGWREE